MALSVKLTRRVFKLRDYITTFWGRGRNRTSERPEQWSYEQLGFKARMVVCKPGRPEMKVPTKELLKLIDAQVVPTSHSSHLN